MVAQDNNIDSNYTQFYKAREHVKVYPTEFVVRTMLANYPNLNYKKPRAGNSILDIAFGDGRNTALLCDMGLEVYGIETTGDIVAQTRVRLESMGCHPDLVVGRNSNIPYEDDKFDYLLACHCCYYCDEGETLADNLNEYWRVLKPGGVVVASVADLSSYIFAGAEKLDDGTMRIKNDPYGNRDGYRLHGFGSELAIEEYFSPLYKNFSFGRAANNYYGVEEKVFWVVCEKRETV